jgi:lipopolysaccharide transport system ATP-binding protein
VSNVRIVAEHLGKRFVHQPSRRPGSWRRLLNGGRRPPAAEPFWALRDVSFTVAAGEMLGVIGRNGAGKSTLLTLLSGLSPPTTGRASVTGRIGALLELGGGFVDDLSGRENAELAGVVAGLTRAEIHDRLPTIVRFAEIADFLEEPVRTYSTGMRMRLAFSVAVHCDPAVLLVDEFLGVGDLAFQAKCRERIAELRAGGCAVVAVSHGLGEVRETCDRVLWLNDGCIAALDTPEVVTELYHDEMRARTLARTPQPERRRLADGRKLGRDGQRLGSMDVELTRVAISPGPVVQSGEAFAVELGYCSRRAVDEPIFGLSITRADGTVCLDTTTEGARVSTAGLPGKGTVRFSIARLELAPGRYFLNAGIFHAQWSHAYDYHWQAHPFSVAGAPEHKGILAPRCRWEVVLSPPPAPARNESSLAGPA